MRVGIPQILIIDAKGPTSERPGEKVANSKYWITHAPATDCLRPYCAKNIAFL